MIRPIQPKSGWKVLVVDKIALRILSASVRMHDIMDEGVSIVEDLTIKRRPIPDMEAIYFITANAVSIDLLIADFKDKKNPMYQTVHIFSTSRIETDLLKKLSESAVGSKIKTLRELNIEYLALESQVFSIDSPDSMVTLYSPEIPSKDNEYKKNFKSTRYFMCNSE